MKITFTEMWEKLKKYLTVDKALEEGFSNGKYTAVLAKYAKKVDAIDVDENFMKIAKENLKDFNNISLHLMDAKNTSFSDKEFDVLLNTSFHEFDLSHGTFSMDLDLKREILKEMVRLSDTIIFVEPTEYAVTNELFTVFDPSERHDIRISKSNELIDTYLKENGYSLVESGITYNDDKFSSREELEEEMLSGSIDLAVHSLKDMPAKVPDGLMIAAVTKRLDPGDALVSNRFSPFSELPQGARVGTSSLRRRAQLLCARPDLTMIDLRGNVNTRLRKLDEGEYDAIVLAVAGLKRLGFADRIREVLPQTMVLPAVGQGALAIETRADDKETRDMLAFLRDDETICCAEAERSFLARVEGGCQVPVGVYATAEGDDLKVEAVIASLDGQRFYRGDVNGTRRDAAKLGENLAEKLLDEGGAEILKELGLLVGE